VDSGNKETRDATVDSASAERRRIRLYWIGLGTYFLIFLNAIRFANRVPYQVFVLGALLNAAIIVGIFILIRRAYRRLRNGSAPKSLNQDRS
jgi:hypothetical protein